MLNLSWLAHFLNFSLEAKRLMSNIHLLDSYHYDEDGNMYLFSHAPYRRT